MSNPAVITLATMRAIKSFPYRFEIEDNIGEAIHIHYKDIRLDLSIYDFLILAETMEEIINDLVDADGFNCNDFEPVNLVGLAPLLPDLQKIVITSMPLEELIVDTYDAEGSPVYRSLKHSRVVKALEGDSAENDAREQVNYYDGNARKQSNAERLNYNLERIKKEGYPVDNELIVLFNDDNIVFDGQHRASCLYYLYGNKTVPVQRLIFKEHKYSGNEVNAAESKKVEILCRDGNKYYGKEQGGVYPIGNDVKGLVIYEEFIGEEIVLDLTGISIADKKDGMILKIQDDN